MPVPIVCFVLSCDTACDGSPPATLYPEEANVGQGQLARSISMGSLRFQLSIFGGTADEPESKVAADKVAEVLKGISQDVQGVCRNLAADDDPSLVAERLRECRIYVEGPPRKGNSVSFPMTAEEDWGILSMQTYASGIAEIRQSTEGSPRLPRGFDISILRRIRDYSQAVVGEEDAGFAVELPPANGTPPVRATFDRRLAAAIKVKLAVIELEEAVKLAPEEMPPDKRVYGYSVQGVLYEMSDPDYLNPDGIVSFEVDPRDGSPTRWLCHLDKSMAPPNLKDLWRTEVLVTGTASMRVRKPVLEADSLVPLPGIMDPVRALDELIHLCKDLSREPVQNFMDRIRERD